MVKQLEERDSIFETSFSMQRIQGQLGCIVANHLKTRPVNINLLICLFVPLSSSARCDILKSVNGIGIDEENSFSSSNLISSNPSKFNLVTFPIE